MALQHLTDEEIRTLTLEQKDRWWLEKVYRGNTAQLTVRAAVTGFLLGGILSSTNLYIGAKTGWSLGVGVTSVVLAYAIFRSLAAIGLARNITILENNCSQSIATAAAYMTGPLISSLAAYMIIDNRLIPWHQIVIWNSITSMLGVLFAFPLKRRFINDQQAPFPEGRAAGVVLNTLHESDGSIGLRHARVLLGAGLIAGAIKFFQSEGIQGFLQHSVLRIKQGAENAVWHLPERLNVIWEAFGLNPKIRDIPFKELTLVPSADLALMGAGGMMGIRAGFSLLVGAILNYCILAPWMISLGQITPKVAANGSVTYGIKSISLWSLWPGVACLVIASFTAIASPKLLIDPIKSLFRKDKSSDVLSHIELPLWISLVGIPVLGFLSAWLAHQYFKVDMLMCLLGLPLMYVLTVVAANSTALTSITPVSATAKITQLFYGVLQPQNVHTNLATAGITAEVVSNASNLLMDLKPGYMLGAKPRLQAISHVIGIVSGAIFSVPLFFVLFTRNVDEKGVASIQSEDFPMPSVTVWKAVAEALTGGLAALPESVRWAVLVGALVGLALEVSRVLSKGRFPLLAVPLGLAFVLDFGSSFAMFMGAFIFWCLGVGRLPTRKENGEPGNWWIEHHEPICAGIIAGAALVGVVDAVISTLMS